MKKEELKISKELVELQMKADKEKHKFKMKELEYARESNKKHHEDEMTRGRIKSAEIRKSQERKAHLQDYGGKR